MGLNNLVYSSPSLKFCVRNQKVKQILWQYSFDIVYGRCSASIFGLKIFYLLLGIGHQYMADEVHLFFVKNQSWKRKAWWRKEIGLLLSITDQKMEQI